MDPGRLLIVSNRLPVSVSVDDGRPVVSRSAGGLATGMRGPHEARGGLWIGWPGHVSGLDDVGRIDLDAQLAAMRAVPVELSRQEIEVFYEQISNAVLWAICHDRINRLPLRVTGWDVYERVNERYADVVVKHWRPGDVIWVHDYHLFRLPALLRKRLPGARIGFFLHVPFPNPDVFFTLAVRRELIEGMLGADLIGFHTRGYRAHFAAALRRLHGIEINAADEAVFGGRRIRVGVFPMGVDAADFATRSSSRGVNTLRLELKPPTQKLIVGIDRLDYSKGIARRLLSFEQLLVSHPEWREKVRMVQIAVPSRGGIKEYRRFRRAVERLVGRINGEYATPGWTPIQYMFQSVSPDVLLALYRAADVMLVTPLRDGMNLVAKEFVAARTDEDGVLVLSEFAGAVDELDDALVVNPYDVDAVARAIQAGLTMDGVERRSRMRRLRTRVFDHDVHKWAEEYLAALSPAKR